MHSDLSLASSAYVPASDEALSAIGTFARQLRPSMVLTNAFIGAEAAKLGYLLSRRLAPTSARPTTYVSFFANSTLEGLSGAIKLARHTAVRRKRSPGGWVLFIDETSQLAPFFDPVGKGHERSLAPHVCFVTSVENARELLTTREWAAVVGTLRPDMPGADLDALGSVVNEARARGALRILCDGGRPLDQGSFFAHGVEADVHVFGENLVDRQVPFGCLTMSADAYAVWNNPRDSVAHTSTFGGNGLCLSLALDALDRHGHVTAEDRAVFARIDRDMRARIDYFAAHVNPFTAQGMEMSGFALDIAEVFGGTLRLRDGDVVTDCAACSGTVLRGHNPADLGPEVLECHDVDHDYFSDLQALLARLTGLEHAFPAVSGATAVDAAVSLAMLANADRSKIVTFTGNFSGKSLISMNLSKYGQQFTESDREAFRPYYFDLVYVDPFAPGAPEELRSVLARGDVALVWFEAIQGMECKPVPGPLLDLVNELRAQHGYLVGVDEVLTGVWRTGGDFLTHTGVIDRADVVTLAKPLSDAIMPMGAALVSTEVLQRATAAHPEQVERLRHHYRNNLGAHIALHALRAVDTPEHHAQRIASQKALSGALRDVAERSKLFEAAEGTGGHARLVLKRRWFPFAKRSQLGKLLEAAISEMILQDCGILVMQLRFFPRIFADEVEIQDAMARLKRGVEGYTPMAVYRHAARQVMSFAVAQTRRNARARRAHRSEALHEGTRGRTDPALPSPLRSGH